MALGAQSSQDFLRAGTSTKSMRLMNAFLDVLRVFNQHKFICFCLDDLQFADDESLDLITQIVSSRMKMVIIVTIRPDEILPERVKGMLFLFTLLLKLAHTPHVSNYFVNSKSSAV